MMSLIDASSGTSDRPTGASSASPDPTPACEDRRVDERFEFTAEDGPVVVEARGVPVSVCTECGEILSGPEAAKIRHDAICRALGLLRPAEIRAIREKVGLTQSDFSRLTGIGEATLSRWERGRLLPNKANDRYLRLMASGPHVLETLRDLSQAAIAAREASALHPV